MAVQKVKLTFSDETTFEGTLRTYMVLPDVIRWENKYNRGASDLQNQETLRVEWLVFFVWRAYNREIANGDGLEFEAFTDSLLEFEAVEDDAVDPTSAAPSPQPQLVAPSA